MKNRNLILYILTGISAIVLSVLLISTSTDKSIVKSSGGPGPNLGIQTPQTYVDHSLITIGSSMYDKAGTPLTGNTRALDSDELSNGTIVTVGHGSGNTGDYAGSSHYISPNHSDSSPIVSNDIYNAKVILSSPTGNIIRVITYSHELYNQNNTWYENDGFIKVIVDPTDDSFYCIGNYRAQQQDTTSTHRVGVVVKYDKYGDFLWDAEFGGTQHDYVVDGYLLPNGNLYIYGHTYSTDGVFTGLYNVGFYDFVPFVMEISKNQTQETSPFEDDIYSEMAKPSNKFDYLLNIYMTETGGGPMAYDSAAYNSTLDKHIAINNDGAYWYISVYDNTFTEETLELFYFKDGAIINGNDITEYGTEAEIEMHSIEFNNSNDTFILSGYFLNNYDGTAEDAYVAKIDSSYSVEWSRLYNTIDNERSTIGTFTADNKVVFAGKTLSSFDGTDPNPWMAYNFQNYEYDIFLIVFNNDGTLYSSSITSDISNIRNNYLTNLLTTDDYDDIYSVSYSASGTLLITGSTEYNSLDYFRGFTAWFYDDTYALNNGVYIKG